MSAYVLAQIQIDDTDEYGLYLAGFMPIFERHGGELLRRVSDRLEREPAGSAELA